VDNQKNNKEFCRSRIPSAPVFPWVWQRLYEQKMLGEAFLVAVSIHVLLFPVMFIIGWVLPWPRTPIITTIVEFDLRNWPFEAKQKKLLDVADPKRNP
jgi:hypothetical protein